MVNFACDGKSAAFSWLFLNATEKEWALFFSEVLTVYHLWLANGFSQSIGTLDQGTSDFLFIYFFNMVDSCC